MGVTHNAGYRAPVDAPGTQVLQSTFMRVRALLGGATVLVSASTACSFVASPSVDVDEAQSAALRQQFAVCLDLPEWAVEFGVDEEARVVHMKWVDNDGLSDRNLGPTSADECIEQLALERYTGE